MAEQEIARHTKKVLSLVSGSEETFLHKLREVGIEIATIVFAVSVSIWFHGLSEHRHEQAQVRSFLLGLKGDLQQDIAQLKNIADSNHSFDATYTYLANLDPAKAPEPKKFEEAYAFAQRNVFFIPNQSRYDGFKSSGKLTNIEDEALLDDIQSLYQMFLPQIRYSEGGSSAKQKRLHEYMEAEFDLGNDTTHRYQLITTPKAKRILQRMAAYPQLYERYQNYSVQAAKIIKAIEHSYPEAKSG